ncbi:hypothetical protein [Tritonibacter mobilis]|uniref:hypothetical protein n=1 Tax=Tritonibacter mobilis TaxID=379347 RepID=UPI003A5BF893
MYTVNKVGGIALVLGGLLNILRMAPIYLSEGVTIWNFPPHDLAGTLMVAGGSGWILSHIMAIISVPLMLVGGFALLEDLSAKGYRGLGFATLSFLSAGSVLYLVAAVADGLVLPYASEAFTEQLSQGSEAAALIIELIHLAATNYGGTMAMFFILTSGLMGLTLLRAYDQRFIGYLGLR